MGVFTIWQACAEHIKYIILADSFGELEGQFLFPVEKKIIFLGRLRDMPIAPGPVLGPEGRLERHPI